MPTKPEDVLTDRTRPFNGKEYLESLRDGREVYIYGERVEDVTTHPAFRNAARSIAQLTIEVNSMATISTMNTASTTEFTDSQAVRIRKAISAMNDDAMNTSPWAKLTMPRMPNTIV